jgi:hypothetical protein
MLIKVYGVPKDEERRYSPPDGIGTEVVPVAGDPDPARRAPEPDDVDRYPPVHATDERLLKEDRQSGALLAIYFMRYNFVRIHRTLRCSPAKDAEVTDRLSSIGDMIALMDVREESAAAVTRKVWATCRAQRRMLTTQYRHYARPTADPSVLSQPT